jgi:hypothetical protein
LHRNAIGSDYEIGSEPIFPLSCRRSYVEDEKNGASRPDPRPRRRFFVRIKIAVALATVLVLGSASASLAATHLGKIKHRSSGHAAVEPGTAALVDRSRSSGSRMGRMRNR